jgi:ubiquinone/menaquinone biosynthesis C-methylase UbiE
MEADHSLNPHYSKAYKDTKFQHDSPDDSRKRMCRRIVEIIFNTEESLNVANIGSGPQALEHQLLSFRSNTYYKQLIDSTHFYTLDIARIHRSRLLMKNRENVQHTRADALHLPFKSSCMDIVFSNMAIDFIPRDSFNTPYEEIYRILKPGKNALFSFHHPNMYRSKLNDGKIEGVEESVRVHWQWLYDNQVLFHSASDIKYKLQKEVGFQDLVIDLASDESDTWWEVTATKPLKY